ncbi:MAG: PA2779 family protein [Nitrospirota bacterium]
MRKKSCFKILSVYLMFAMIMLSLPAHGWAMFLPSDQAASVRQADMISIQKALETTVVEQRLRDLGLSPEEALARIDSLSDEQVHQFAGNLDSLQAGADGLGALIFLVLVVILVVVILQATGHRVIVR